MASVSSPQHRAKRNSSIDGLNVHGLAKATRKTLERLAPFCLLRPTGLAQDVGLTNRVVDKIKTFIGGIDSSMLAAQMALRLAEDAIRLSEINVPGQEWSVVPRRADEGLSSLAGLAAIGDSHAQKMTQAFTDVRQDIYKVAAWTKEKRNVMVIIPLDPEQPNHNLTKSLRDVGLDLHANVSLVVDFVHHITSLAKWWDFVKQELDAAAAVAALTSDPNVQPTSPTSPGAMALPPALNADVWKKVQSEYHSYFRTIREIQARYPSLVAASNEAWKPSAQVISLAPSSSESDESNEGPSSIAAQSSDPPPLSTTATPSNTLANPNASPTTPSSPTTYYDARSRPLSMAVDDANGQSDNKADKSNKKKRRGFSISPSKSASGSGSGSGSSTTPELTTDPKLSMKKMREFLFTRTVPRPEVRGLFPSSVRMSMSRSKSSAGKSGLSEQEKGKGKEKDEGSGKNGNAAAVEGGKQEKLDRIVSLMNLRGTSTTTTAAAAAEVGGAGTEKEEKQNEKLRPSVAENDLLAPPPQSRTRSHSPSRSPSPASVRSRHSRSLLNVETHKGGAVEAEADAVGEDSDAVGNDADVVAGQLIDEQTAVKSRTGFAIFRVAEALVRGGVKTICGTCFGYGD